MNDLEKPIVAQIYRLWQDEAGKKWINSCWYYRPEQTIHRVSKRFYRNEVMKTGQYRDHLIDDIVDRCFVMFHTRYHKGRPRGLPVNKDVYVCEARYNEERFTFNRIKTWTSCLPDEVREKDYEMDLFDIPHKITKEPTPIAHLINENAKETDTMPKPNWGHKDAPPIIGGVHIRPREPNVSHSPNCILIPALHDALGTKLSLPYFLPPAVHSFSALRQRRHLRRVVLCIFVLCLGSKLSRGSDPAAISLSCQTRLIRCRPLSLAQTFLESSLPLKGAPWLEYTSRAQAGSANSTEHLLSKRELTA